MKNHFWIGHFVPALDVERTDKTAGNARAFKTFDRAAIIADKVRMHVHRLVMCIADRIQPGTVIAAHTVDEFLADEGVERAVDGYRVHAFKLGQHLRNTQRLSGILQQFDHANAHGRAAQAVRAEKDFSAG